VASGVCGNGALREGSARGRRFARRSGVRGEFASDGDVNATCVTG
jgi:hypothetical protein